MTFDYTPLPVPTDCNGNPRRIGVEIEFGGLPEDKAARMLAQTYGGQALLEKDPIWVVEGSRLGDFEVYLDVFFRNAEKSALRDLGLKVGREVIPVEVVTEPLSFDQMKQLDRGIKALREAGAKGSGDGVLYGFGIHLNVQSEGLDVDSILRPLLAFAMIEDWMRKAMPIDGSRQIIPFTEAYPTRLVSDLIDLGEAPSADQLVDTYLTHCPDRNRGLDMLPLLMEAYPDKVTAILGASKANEINARPTFHFRLPDCLIDDPEWSLAKEWHRWWLVEKIAGDPALMARLRHEWKENHGKITLLRSTWADRCGEILDEAGLVPEAV